ncbi:MAG: flagellar motor switch protein FliG [Comamonadaceae bacterium]|jgi:flagellar motor switch protein FliG|nr:flagellar motor switch protein FliG [Rhodoferax sp.]TSA06003.1 MAG: flagellar motor switch protein FliG [Comamonadaceae bacterium]
MAEAEKMELIEIDPAKELASMSTTERAAVLMLLLGEQQAADIIRYLNPKEVQALGASMVAVSDLSQEAVNAVLDEFVATIKRQTNLGLGTTDYVEKVFRRALGDDKAASVLGRITPGHGSKGLEILSWMDARSIADMIQDEHPQVVAIILSVLEHEVAADVLIFLPPDSRAEVMQRVANLETVQPSAMEELESIMKKQFSNNSSAKSSSFGGIKAAAKIMNLTKAELESAVMKKLGEMDADLTQKIQDNMFTFENLTGVDNKGIQVLMRNVEPDLMMSALKGANEEVKEKFLGNMSERARGMFKDDMEAKGPMRLADVEVAQKTIMRIARKLADSGDLVLGGGADYV